MNIRRIIKKKKKRSGSHFQELVADVDATILGSAAAWMKANDEDAHLRPIFVSSQTYAESLITFLKIHQKQLTTDVPIFLPYFSCK